MVCYGIGVSRLLATIVESHNDASGTIWPREAAPFDLEILPLLTKDDGMMDLADTYYKDFRKNGFDVLMDDRDLSAGMKFNDADLIGIPLRITIGKRTLTEGKVEIKNRQTNETITIDKNEALKRIAAMLNKQNAE